MDEPVMQFLRRRLREAGKQQFEQIAAETGTTPTLLPKLAYGMRDNPRILSIQPLLDYFRQADRAAGRKVTKSVKVTKNVTRPPVKRRAKNGCKAGSR